MCGIACAFHYGEKKKETVNKEIVDQYQDQEIRGKSGFGAIMIKDKNKPVNVLRATGETKILVDMYMNPVMGAIFHHRAPTSSANKISQTHPMEIMHETLEFNWLIVHNGVIQNDTEVYRKHKELNFIYKTYYEEELRDKHGTKEKMYSPKFNDSEGFAIELARYIEGKTEIMETYGSMAFVALQCTKDWKPLKLHFGRNSKNPLYKEIGNGYFYMASDRNGELVEENIIFSTSIENPGIELEKKELKTKEAPITTMGYHTGYIGTKSAYHNHENSSRICDAKGCLQYKIGRSKFCAEHCAPEELMGTDKDRRPFCDEVRCMKRAKDGGKKCKKHKHLEKVEDTKQTEMKTTEETEAEDIEYEIEINIKETESYKLAQAVMDEYYEFLEAGMIADKMEYSNIIERLMEVAEDETRSKLMEYNIDPDTGECDVSEGEKAISATAYVDTYDDRKWEWEQENYKKEQPKLLDMPMDDRHKELNGKGIYF